MLFWGLVGGRRVNEASPTRVALSHNMRPAATHGLSRRLLTFVCMVAAPRSVVGGLLLHSNLHLSAHAASPHRLTIRLCAPEQEDEIARTQRRRDEAALRSEWDVGSVSGSSGGGGSDRPDDFDPNNMLRERIDLLETKEKDLAEIKEMLRIMQAQIGIAFVNEEGEILATAWIFVAFNLALAAYLVNSLVLEPAARSIAGFQ